MAGYDRGMIYRFHPDESGEVIAGDATNSAKYGSLSSRAGKVEVTFARTAFGDLALGWRDAGAPPRARPIRCTMAPAIRQPGPPSSRSALAAIADSAPDFAIIDFNLAGESSEPIAAALRAAGVRFARATGYSEGAGSFERLGAAAVLRKPLGTTEIDAVAGRGLSVRPRG